MARKGEDLGDGFTNSLHRKPPSLRGEYHGLGEVWWLPAALGVYANKAQVIPHPLEHYICTRKNADSGRVFIKNGIETQ